MEIAPYTLEIRPGLLCLYKDVAAQRIGIARLPHEITDEYIEHIVSSTLNQGLGFVAKIDGKIVGDIHAEYPTIYIFRNILWNLTAAVNPKFQRNGIGRALFQTLICEARKNPNLERIELFCKERNTNAIKLYQSLGFQIEGVLRKRVNLDGTPENDLVMGYVIE